VTPEEKQEEERLKRVEYYAATVNTWYNSTLEHDKSLLTLSTGGIGILITILTTVGISYIYQIIVYFISIFSFLICLITILRIFKENKTHIENIIKGSALPDDPKLKNLDNIAYYSFFIGIIFSAIIGFSTAFHSLYDKVSEMAKDNGNKGSVSGHAFDSVNGALNLRTPTVSSRSVNGAVNIQPCAPVSAAPVAIPGAPAAPTTTPATPTTSATPTATTAP